MKIRERSGRIEKKKRKCLCTRKIWRSFIIIYCFKGLEEDIVKRFAKRQTGYEKEFSRGRCFFRRRPDKTDGDPYHREVRVCRLELDGGEKLLQKLRPTFLVGADIVCTPSQISPYTAYADERSRIWYFPYENIKNPGKIPEEARRHMKERLLEFIANENIRKLYKVDMLSAANGREKI